MYLLALITMAIIVIVYLSLPELRGNLQGKIIIGFYSTLFLTLVTQTLSRFILGECNYLAYLIYFLKLATIAWMNVICFDVFITIRFITYAVAVQNSQNNMHFKRYVACVYCYSLLLTLLVLTIDGFSLFPYENRPRLAELRCWLASKYCSCFLSFHSLQFAYLADEQRGVGYNIYQSIPASIQLTLNGILFIGSVIEYWRMKRSVKHSRTDTPPDYVG